MKSLMIASAAALAFATVPAAAGAQMQNNMSQPNAPMTAEQQRMYDALEADERMVYDRLPREQQQYYMTLNPQQQEAWFLLNDDQRMRLYSMEPTQRTAAWTSIMQQVNAASAGTPGMMQQNTSAMNNSMTSGNIRFVSSTVAQPIVGDQAAYAPSGEVPVCGANQYDNCMNAWEAGRRGPGVEKPLDYYPGPAGPNTRR